LREEERYGMYDENDLADYENKHAIFGSGAPHNPEVYDQFKKRQGRKRKTYIRKQSTIYFEDEITRAIEDNDDGEEDNMELNGDYILKKALLKDHDVQLLRTKEMQHVLTE
jgi:hypothetical protein